MSPASYTIRTRERYIRFYSFVARTTADLVTAISLISFIQSTINKKTVMYILTRAHRYSRCDVRAHRTNRNRCVIGLDERVCSLAERKKKYGVKPKRSEVFHRRQIGTEISRHGDRREISRSIVRPSGAFRAFWFSPKSILWYRHEQRAIAFSFSLSLSRRSGW